MRIVGAALAVLVVVMPSASHAEEFPWCVEVDVFTKNCAFASRNECVEMARNLASPATGPGRCIANANYQPPKSAKGAAKTSVKTPPKPQ